MLNNSEDLAFEIGAHRLEAGVSYWLCEGTTVSIIGPQALEISLDKSEKEDVICHETLGELLKHYERYAA